MQQIEVTEIFHSIQGESTFSGMPCSFIRLSGCNLRCSFCDTEYSYEKGQSLEIDEIISKIDSFGCRLVEITGGEPLLNPNTPELVNKLLSKGYRVLVETNGSLDIDLVDKRCSRIVDVKCPGSLMSDRNDFSNMKRLTDNDQLKFVIKDRKDFDYMIEILERYRPNLPFGSIIASPVAGEMSPHELAAWILSSGLEIRMQLQLHRIIWPGIDKGV